MRDPEQAASEGTFATPLGYRALTTSPPHGEPMALNDQRATVIRLAIAAAVLVGGYVGLAAWSAGHLPTTASVGGIPVGGLFAGQLLNRLGFRAVA